MDVSEPILQKGQACAVADELCHPKGHILVVAVRCDVLQDLQERLKAEAPAQTRRRRVADALVRQCILQSRACRGPRYASVSSSGDSASCSRECAQGRVTRALPAPDERSEFPNVDRVVVSIGQLRLICPFVFRHQSAFALMVEQQVVERNGVLKRELLSHRKSLGLNESLP